MTAIPALVGMVHLAPLPGSPGYAGSIDRVIAAAVEDAATLRESGFPAVMVENFGDAPFFPDRVPPVTVAAMARVISELRLTVDVLVGVNVLRNDAAAAVSIAAVTGAAMVRVNVLSGTMYTDQGPIVGRAAEVARLLRDIAPDVAVLADVFVKHASPPPGLTIEQAAVDTWERGGAHALVVSGTGTGIGVAMGELRRVRDAVPDAPLLVGSGVTPDTLPVLAELATGIIVGSWVKVDGRVSNPVDPVRARRLADAAGAAGLA